MTVWQAIVLGLVEGITEFLPVSSTGHLILANWLLGLDDPARQEAVNSFAIVIQGGAILAVLIVYVERVRSMLAGVFGRDEAGRRLLINLAVAFVPAAVTGLLLDDLLEAWLFRPAPVLFALAAGGVWMVWLDRRGTTAAGTRGVEDLRWTEALAIGAFQCLALWPGTSRSMSTIAGGTILGLRARDAAEFSFLLGLPTLGGACLYSLAKDLMHARETGGPNLFQLLGVTPVLVGIVVAAVSAAVAVRWLVAFLGRRGLAPFGWYRIGLALVLGVLVATGLVDFG